MMIESPYDVFGVAVVAAAYPYDHSGSTLALPILCALLFGYNELHDPGLQNAIIEHELRATEITGWINRLARGLSG